MLVRVTMTILVLLTISQQPALCASAAPGGDPPRVGWAQAVVLDESVRPAVPGGEKSQQKVSKIGEWILRNLDKVVPMPLPAPVDSGSDKAAAVGLSSPISFDLKTGEESFGEPADFLVKSALAFHNVGSLGAVDLDRRAPAKAGETVDNKDFKYFFEVQNPEEYPWRVSAKLHMKFRDVTGEDRSGACSGTFIDSTHVITAGHCVFAHEMGGFLVNDWAREVVVIPGYEEGRQPYGHGVAVGLHTWLGWAIDRNYDHDIGVIDLERPVGALTGWFGYAASSSCRHFTDSDFGRASYPGDPVFRDLMWASAGDYDGCEAVAGYWYGNKVYFNSRSWEGQSGSAAWEPSITCPFCAVWTVLSNGDSHRTYDTRITENKLYHIAGFIAEDTPAQFDLVPLGVEISPATAFPGDQLSSMWYLVHNNSFSQWSGDVLVEVYLSDNETISPFDTLIQTHAFSWDFTAKSSVWITVVPPPTIPRAAAGGGKFLGVILQAADAVVGNNASGTQDVALLEGIFADGFESGDTSAWSRG